MILTKYKQNLKIVGDFIYSYNTRVAHISHVAKTIFIVPKYYKYSKTTSKHINYVANELGYRTERFGLAVNWYLEIPEYI